MQRSRASFFLSEVNRVTQPVKPNSASFKIHVISIGPFISIMDMGLFDISIFRMVLWDYRVARLGLGFANTVIIIAVCHLTLMKRIERGREAKRSWSRRGTGCDLKACVSWAVLSAGGTLSACGAHSRSRPLASGTLRAQVWLWHHTTCWNQGPAFDVFQLLIAEHAFCRLQ